MALQVLDFRVIREDFLDDGDQISAHRIEIGQRVDWPRFVVTAIEDVKHVAVETERDLNRVLSVAKRKEDAIIGDAGFMNGPLIRRRPLEEAL
jgi:hypothetical protein